MVGHAMERLQPKDNSLLLIENVGNLVCPASFNLGEAHKVVILSVTEGEDKPLKYPDMFAAADMMLLNKPTSCPTSTSASHWPSNMPAGSIPASGWSSLPRAPARGWKNGWAGWTSGWPPSP